MIIFWYVAFDFVPDGDYANTRTATIRIGIVYSFSTTESIFIQHLKPSFAAALGLRLDGGLMGHLPSSI